MNAQRAPHLPAYISTGDIELDEALGGGWPIGATLVEGAAFESLPSDIPRFSGDADDVIARANDALVPDAVVAAQVAPQDMARVAQKLAARALYANAAVLLMPAPAVASTLMTALRAAEEAMVATGRELHGEAFAVAARVEVTSEGPRVTKAPPVQDEGDESEGYGVSASVLGWLRPLVG